MTDIRNDNIAVTAWSDMVESAIALRHDLHRHPELPWQEQRTASVIRERLSALDIPWRACADTGTVAQLAPQSSGTSIALRTDIDALPIHEKNAFDHRSSVDGCMHACGHDGHSATLFAALWWLKKQESTLPGPVTLLFQPAEEGGHGAKKMIEDGALTGVDKIFGWHNWPAIQYGKAICPDGPVMAANGTFRITLTGKGGHASQPELCRDPVLAASAVTIALQQLVSRRLAPQHAVVISVTNIQADSADTIIPEQAQLGGSIRLARNELRETVESLITTIARDTALAYGVEADVELFPRYQATINNRQEAQLFRGQLQAELGSGWHSENTAVPIMASEDFSYYLNEIPGAYALVGAGKPDSDNPPCHSADYDFNDNLIETMGRVFARLAGAPIPE